MLKKDIIKIVYIILIVISIFISLSKNKQIVVDINISKIGCEIIIIK
jgi:hypothetical protein